MIPMSAAAMLAAAGAAIAAAAGEYDNPNRVEKQRADLAGAPGMEVINSVTRYAKGESVRAHFHHGAESAYVVQGTTIQRAGKAPEEMRTGTTILNRRDAVHGGYVVVGDTPLILFSVHVVDKGRPLYDWTR